MSVKELQDSLVKALDIISGSAASSVDADRTVQASVVRQMTDEPGKWLVKYDGGTMYAYDDNSRTYSENDSVYVLVPRGDFSARKVIVSRAGTAADTYVSSVFDDYREIGRSVMTCGDTITLPIRNGRTELLGSFASVDDDLVHVYRENATGVILSFDVLTNHVPRSVRTSDSAAYAVAVTCTYDGHQVTYMATSDKFVGDPFDYDANTTQRFLFSFEDGSLFESVDAVSVAFSGIDEDGGSISLSGMSLTFVDKSVTTDGEYRLSVITPYGSTFSDSPTAKVSMQGRFTKSGVSLDGAFTKWMWFVEDARVYGDSKGYSPYGGSGWRLLDESTSTLSVNKTDNLAYKNKYKCVAIYQGGVATLSNEITIYNPTAQMDIAITSSLGTQFSFHLGKTDVVCTINGYDHEFDRDKRSNRKDDSDYHFHWVMEDGVGGNRVVFDSYGDMSDKAKYGKNGLFQGLSGNRFSFDAKNISTYVRFTCQVMVVMSDGNEYSIGSANLTLVNDNTTMPQDNYVILENGTQMFQYDELGTCADTPLPVTAKLYSTNGTEITSNVSFKWEVPSGKSLVKASGTEGNVVSFDIADKYDVDATDNQLTAVVTYAPTNGAKKTYRRTTSLMFFKIGDSGTNGTTYTGAVTLPQSPVLDDELLTFYTVGWGIPGDGVPRTNVGAPSVYLGARLTNGGEDVTNTVTKVDWSILSRSRTATSRLAFERTGADVDVSVMLRHSAATDVDAMRDARAAIVKCEMQYDDGKSMYSYLPVPLIDCKTDDDVSKAPRVMRDRTLREVTYDSNGDSPTYVSNAGVHVTGLKWASKVLVMAYGGMDGHQPSLSVAYPFDSNDAQRSVTVCDVGDDLIIKVIPDPHYNGVYVNQAIVLYAYDSSNVARYEITVPIIMTLNAYAVKGLNAWDGSSVTVNNDDTYVVAPQIGAGSKDSRTNLFSGILMGQKVVRSKSPSLGLYGFNEGRQTFELNAEDGSASFGRVDNEDQPVYGQIKVNADGSSEIGNWHVGQNSIYSVAYPDMPKSDVHGNHLDEWYDAVDDRDIIERTYGAPELAKPDVRDKYAVKGATGVIPHDKQGIMISSLPAYLSVKGVPFTRKDISDADYSDVGTVLCDSDSMEVEMDPRKMSIFSVYRHTVFANDDPCLRMSDGNSKLSYVSGDSSVTLATFGEDGKWSIVATIPSGRYRGIPCVPVQLSDDGNTWGYALLKDGITSVPAIDVNDISSYGVFRYRRYPLIGINNKGQFFTNAVENGQSNLSIGPIGAYGHTAAQRGYIGADFAYDGLTLLKMFVEAGKSNSPDAPLTIQTATDVRKEWQRPLSVRAKSYDVTGDGIQMAMDSTHMSIGTGSGDGFYGIDMRHGRKDEPSRIVSRHGRNDITNGVFTTKMESGQVHYGKSFAVVGDERMPKVSLVKDAASVSLGSSGLFGVSIGDSAQMRLSENVTVIKCGDNFVSLRDGKSRMLTLSSNSGVAIATPKTVTVTHGGTGTVTLDGDSAADVKVRGNGVLATLNRSFAINVSDSSVRDKNRTTFASLSYTSNMFANADDRNLEKFQQGWIANPVLASGGIVATGSIPGLQHSDMADGTPYAHNRNNSYGIVSQSNGIYIGGGVSVINGQVRTNELYHLHYDGEGAMREVAIRSDFAVWPYDSGQDPMNPNGTYPQSEGEGHLKVRSYIYTGSYIDAAGAIHSGGDINNDTNRVNGAYIEGNNVNGTILDGNNVNGTYLAGKNVNGATISGNSINGVSMSGGTIYGPTISGGGIYDTNVNRDITDLYNRKADSSAVPGMVTDTVNSDYVRTIVQNLFNSNQLNIDSIIGRYLTANGYAKKSDIQK